MSNELQRLILAVVVGAHGIGHTLFLFSCLGVPKLGQSTRSWLLTNLIGDGGTRAVGSLLWLIATVAFIAVGIGLYRQAEWWRTLSVITAILSVVGLVLFWGSPVTGPAMSALIFNIVVLAALLLLRWPPQSVIGA
jgi:hypothetical protein